MSEVTLQIGGRPYTVTCAAGQETHIEMLGKKIQEKLDDMEQLAPQRSQNLLFAALFLADELHEANENSSANELLESELANIKAAQKDAEAEQQELQLERDALLSERDTMRADHDAVKAQLSEAQTQIAQLNAANAAQDSPGSDDLDVKKLAELAETLEKTATELEQRASAS